MTRTIEIIVSPAGEIQIDALGFKGAGCEQATRFLEEALGRAVRKKRKPEHHQAARHHPQQSIGR